MTTPVRKPAWGFSFDGHVFYVLDLGSEGTWVYDLTTKQWSNWYTSGYQGQFDMTYGANWGIRVIGGDLTSTTIWELDPNAVADNGVSALAITHVVTGMLVTRNRQYISCSAVRLACSSGKLDNPSGATLSFRFSDDQGNTWSDTFTETLTYADTSQEIAFYGMGSFAAPGRVFEISDVGGLIRIDGLDVGLNDFDDDNADKGQAT